MTITKISRNLLDTGISDSSDATAITIDSSERVGIGSTSPAGKLMVREDTAGNPARLIISNGGTAQSGTTSRLSFYEATDEKSYIERRRDNSGITAFVTPADDNPFVWENASGEFMRFTNSRVGIGTSSPTGKLEIAATGTNAAPHIKLTESSDTREFNIYNDGSGNGRLVLADSDDDTPDTEIVLADNGVLQFKTANSERMRIDSDGLIGVGTTSPASNGGANAGLIHLHGGSADWAVLHCTTPTTGSAAANGALLGTISDDIYVFNYASAGIINFGTNNTIVGQFVVNGDFYTNDGTVHSLSDKRIKTNIQPISEGLDIIKQLNPVTYEYCNTYTGEFNGIGVDDGRTHKGFIADEVQEVAPSYVEETTGVVLGEEVDDLKTLSMTAMIPMLVKSIQEQQEQIEALQSEINTLKGE